MVEQILTLGIPSGSLYEPTIGLFQKAGFAISGGIRSYRPMVDDAQLNIRLLRAQEMSRYIEQGYLDCGITGRDWIEENSSHVYTIQELCYNKATKNATRWVVAVAANSPYYKIQDLEGKRIATEAVNLTKKFFEKKNINVHIEFSWGSTEAKVPDLVDAIVDITETGNSLKANNLRIIDVILESYPLFIANHTAYQDRWKCEKMDQISLLLAGAISARDKVGIKMNVPKKKLSNILDALPSLRNPTISPLADTEWFAVETIINETTIREIIPKLKSIGAEGIIEYPLNKVVY